MQVLLIHGQGRSPLSMWPLARRLRQHGHTPHYFGYAGFAQPFERIVDRLVQTVPQKIGLTPYAIVTHSLGGVITRAALPRLVDNLPQQLVMLAPPNHPATLAKKLRNNPLYRLATGDCGQKLGNDDFFKSLPLPIVPKTIIAGTKGWQGKMSPFGNRPNDSLLLVEETELKGSEIFYVPVRHSVIMYSRQVADIVVEVLGRVN